MLVRKKSPRYIINKFKLNWKISALLLMMQKITQLQKKEQLFVYIRILIISLFLSVKFGT
jgi:hypothetical protein